LNDDVDNINGEQCGNSLDFVNIPPEYRKLLIIVDEIVHGIYGVRKLYFE
jgi:hypothetical protein